MTSTKKILTFAIVAMFVATGLAAVAGECIPAAEADGNDDVNVAICDATGTELSTYTGDNALNDAIAAVGEDQTVKLLRSFEGNGVMIGASPVKTYALNIDFNYCTYTVKTLVGSPGTESQAFHIEGMFTEVKMSNGTIRSVDDLARMLVQNYVSLTLDNMVLDGSNLVQGCVYGTTTYTDVYTSSNNGGSIVYKDSSIIATKVALKDGKTAYAFDADSTCTGVTLKGANTIDGSIHFWNDDKQFVVDGITEIASGTIDSADTMTVTLCSGSSIVFDEGVTNKFTKIGDGNSVAFSLKTIVAGEGGVLFYNYSQPTVFALANDTCTCGMSGTVTAEENGTISTVSNGVRIEGNIGENVTLTIKNDVVLTDELTVEEGATLVKYSTGTITSDDYGGTDIVMEAGSKYQQGMGSATTITEKTVENIDSEGNVTEMVRVEFVSSEHVSTITFYGFDCIENTKEDGLEIRLADIYTEVDDGYRVTGFVVDGETCGLYDTVVITSNCEIYAVAEPIVVYDDSNNATLAAIVAVALVLIAAFAVVGYSAKE